MLNAVLRPTKSALGYTCFSSAGVFQFALRTTPYHASRLAFASGCRCQKCSRAPRFMMRIETQVLTMRTWSQVTHVPVFATLTKTAGCIPTSPILVLQGLVSGWGGGHDIGRSDGEGVAAG